MVSIVAFQAVDPGSIPGHRNFFFMLFCTKIFFFFQESKMWPLLALFLALLSPTVLSLELEVLNEWNLLDLNIPYDYGLINNFRYADNAKP